MISASLPFPVFMKNVFSRPSWSFDVIFEVDAELQPPPPAEDTVVFSGSSWRSFTRAESSFIVCLDIFDVPFLRVLIMRTCIGRISVSELSWYVVEMT
jgi:hypothetical protein